jgi:hypothetical protein
VEIISYINDIFVDILSYLDNTSFFAYKSDVASYILECKRLNNLSIYHVIEVIIKKKKINERKKRT